MYENVFNEEFLSGQYYESVNGNLIPCPIVPFGIAVGSSATVDLIAAITGKVIVVLTVNISAYTGSNTFQFQSKPAGAASILMDGHVVYQNDRYLGADKTGVLRTLVGEGLRFVAGASSIINVYGQYVAFTPRP